jgi:hypothetical protein
VILPSSSDTLIAKHRGYCAIAVNKALLSEKRGNKQSSFNLGPRVHRQFLNDLHSYSFFTAVAQ